MSNVNEFLVAIIFFFEGQVNKLKNQFYLKKLANVIDPKVII